MEKGPKCASR